MIFGNWNNNCVLRTLLSKNLQPLQSCRPLALDLSFVREFTPCFLKHLPQEGLVWLAYVTCKESSCSHNSNRVEILWLCWPLHYRQNQRTFSSRNRSCIVWTFGSLACCRGRKWLQSDAVHTALYVGVAVIAIIPQDPFHSPLHRYQTITLPPCLDRWCQALQSIFTWSADHKCSLWNASNFDLSLHNTSSAIFLYIVSVIFCPS